MDAVNKFSALNQFAPIGLNMLAFLQTRLPPTLVYYGMNTHQLKPCKSRKVISGTSCSVQEPPQGSG